MFAAVGEIDVDGGDGESLIELGAWFEPGCLVVVVSPVARQSGEFMDKVRAFARRLEVKKRGDGHNEMSQVFPTGSRIVGLPGVEGNIRGFSKVALMLIDEAARVPDELFYAVLPMVTKGNGDLWLMRTLLEKTGGAAGVLLEGMEPAGALDAVSGACDGVRAVSGGSVGGGAGNDGGADIPAGVFVRIRG